MKEVVLRRLPLCLSLVALFVVCFSHDAALRAQLACFQAGLVLGDYITFLWAKELRKHDS